MNINYGLFINSIVSFLIVAFAVFLLVRAANRLRRRRRLRRAQGLPLLPHGDSDAATRCSQCTSELR